ncbi:MAG: AAA family ATPase [Acidobacteria bacterium]|nr:AAA family ATPase [Acidobacteriota bacterium]
MVTPGRKITSELLPVVSQEIPTAQVIELQGYPLDGKLGDVGQAGGSLCFLDLITSEEQGLKALIRILEVNPSLPVISLVPDSNPQLILQALRVGAKDFLTQPFTNDQFRTVMEKLSQVVPELAAEQGRVVTVVPAKGGCGASTLAFNLAMQLKRSGSNRTLLADLDPVTGTQAFQMKLKPGFSFLDILSQGTSLDADVWRGVVQTYSGIDVLLSPHNPVEGAQEVGDTRPIIDFSRRMYDFIVADLGSAYGEWSLSAVRFSDEVFVVTTNELPALQAAQRVINYYENNSISRQRIRLVINRFNRDVGLTKEMIETALQSDIFQLINSDYEDVQRALLDGKPIQATSTIGKQIHQITERLLGHDVDHRKKKSEKARSGGGLSGLFGIFSRST